MSSSASKTLSTDVVDMSVYRNDFPIFDKKMNGKSLVYLDSASSAQKPACVIDKYSELYNSNYSNIHRGLYSFSQVNTEEYEDVRKKASVFINASSENEIVFTKNSTEAINLVANSWGKDNLQAGDEIILSGMEHHANIVPWQLLSAEIGFKIKIIPVLGDGELDFDAFLTLLSNKTRFIGVVHASNALGTLNNVEKIAKTVKKHDENIKILTDGSQSIVHMPINVQLLGCDFFVFTGHKLYGPNGVGVLWGKQQILEMMTPYQGGGDMIETVGWEQGATTYKSAPAKFEAGTPAIAEVLALGVAIDYLSDIGMDNIVPYEQKMLKSLVSKLKGVDGLNYYGQAEDKVGVVSFTADWAHASDIAMILDQCGVAVRTGHHCCMPLMQRFGIDATVRASLGLYNNENDIDVFVSSLKKAKEMLS